MLSVKKSQKTLFKPKNYNPLSIPEKFFLTLLMVYYNFRIKFSINVRKYDKQNSYHTYFPDGF